MRSLSVVIPAYNEEGSLDDLLARCFAVLPHCAEEYDVTIVDDGSTDGTSGIIQRWVERHPATMRCIRHPERRGIAAAYAAAYAAATNDRVAMLHADGQYPPEVLPACLSLLDDHDIVLMVRRRKHYGLLRFVISSLYRWLTALLFGIDLRDPGCSKCMRREVLRDIPIRSTSIFSEAERLVRADRKGYRIAFVTVDAHPRANGMSHGCSMRVLVATLVDMVKFRLRP